MACEEHGYKEENCPLCALEERAFEIEKAVMSLLIWAQTISEKLELKLPPKVYGFDKDGNAIY